MSGMHPEMIRAEIKMKGLSLADVAAMAGITVRTVCRVWVCYTALRVSVSRFKSACVL